MAGPHDRDSRPNRPHRAHGRPRTEHRERRENRDTPEKRASRDSPEKRKSRDTPEKRTPRDTPERREKRSSHNWPEKESPRHHQRSPERRQRQRPISYTSSERSSDPLSFDSLAKLDAVNEKLSRQPQEKERLLEPREKDRSYVRQKEKVVTGRVIKDRGKHRRKSDYHREKRRVVSGPLAEEGRAHKREAYIDEESGKKRFGRKCKISAIVVIVLLIILIPVGIYASKKNGGGGESSGGGADPANSNLKDVSESDIPAAAKNTVLDPFTWYDTTDFNVTYTNVTVGGLSIMGLNSAWDDKAQANSNVPALNKKFAYGAMPMRGVNLGGWLSLEPFITPSFFSSYKESQGIIDEYTLTKELGPQKAAKTLEKHYSQFIQEEDFKAMRDAGFDHVRIPYSYWAVTTYPGDPYVPKISWRYLLRGIEYCRKYGLRVNLDLHALPGSQNGWNHSGRQGAIGWLNGTDGDLNAQRSLDIHTQLSTFFAQPRYDNVITIYGLANEPKMIKLKTSDVVAWEAKAIDIVRKNGMQQYVAIGDGFLGLTKWNGQLSGVKDVILDVHQYTIFNKNQINFTHQKKIQYACQGWTEQMKQSVDVSTGFGPTICGEWSQADTDCTLYLNNVHTGSRWEGTLPTGDPTTSVTEPDCPPNSGTCSCDKANADPSSYSDDYKQWLMMYAEAQMVSFEQGWGWFYWTWTAESATQWSWKAGLAAGILPKKTWQRDFNCTTSVPDFKDLPENY